MGLIDYVFRRLVAYEAIRTVASAQSATKSPRRTSGEKEYLATLRFHGPALGSALQALGTTDMRSVLPAIKSTCVAFLADLDQHPAPPHFARADTEYRLALNILINSVDTHTLQPGEMELAGWEYLLKEDLRQASTHLKAGNTLTR